MLVNQTFLYKNGSHRYKSLVVNEDRTFFTNEETSAGKKHDETLICQIIDFVIDNIYIKTGNHLFRQCIGVVLANLFLYSYEVEFLRSMKKSNKKLAKAFNSTSCYIDDLISVSSNPRFKQFLKDIYPEELVVSETSESRNVVSYLSLLIEISNGDLVCSIFDNRMHLIWILSIFLTYLKTFQQPQHIHLTADKIKSGLP